MDIKVITPQFIREAYKKIDAAFFSRDDKPFNLNIWGIRSADMTSDKYNDFIGFTYIFNGKYFHKVFVATTDPGLYYLKNPMNSAGAPLLVHDKQYRGVYQFGKHNPGKPTEHDALRQIKPMTYWRDNNRDDYRDCDGPIHTSLSFTNLHSRKPGSSMLATIGKTSAGCQVIASPSIYFADFIPVVKAAIPYWGDKFTYTLFFEPTIL